MPKFVESFDSYNGLAAGGGLLSRWMDESSGIGVRQRLETGRFGTGQAFNMASGNGSAMHQISAMLQDSTGSFFTANTFSLHVAISCNTALLSTSSDEKGFTLGNSGGIGQLGLRYLNGTWQVVRWGAVAGGTPAAVLATSSVSYADSNWRSFQLKGVVDSSAGSFELIIDGGETLSATGVNTGTGTIDRVTIITGNTGSTSIGAGLVFDDIVVENFNAAHLPMLRIDGLPPNADGATLNLVPSTGTSHFGVVDESIVATADYLSGTNVGDIDLLGVTNMSVAPSRIVGVNLVGWAQKTDVAARAWNLGLKSGGVTSNGPDMTLNTGVGYFSRMVDNDPATVAEWLKSGVDAIELQPRIAV